MKAELVKKALDKVGNPNLLVNLISRRVRQLSSGGGSMSRPLVLETAGLGFADIALTEIVEGKITFEMIEDVDTTEVKPVRRRRSAAAAAAAAA
ncbi:MAG TPA: DNA-directed RNA polymerase subunit omega [Verrucomicrobiota bacterium]|nr:DNA-directed RNA polymerase subunit omega [Verrucomicrobiota bacterium]